MEVVGVELADGETARHPRDGYAHRLQGLVRGGEDMARTWRAAAAARLPRRHRPECRPGDTPDRGGRSRLRRSRVDQTPRWASLPCPRPGTPIGWTSAWTTRHTGPSADARTRGNRNVSDVVRDAIRRFLEASGPGPGSHSILWGCRTNPRHPLTADTRSKGVGRRHILRSYPEHFVDCFAGSVIRARPEWE